MRFLDYDDREEYRREQWERDHEDVICPACGQLMEPFVYGSDADGHRGEKRWECPDGDDHE